jgi:hypothetical protein
MQKSPRFVDYNRAFTLEQRQHRIGCLRGSMVWSIVLLLILAALPLNASAQGPSFKDKSARVIVGFPQGGGSDAEMISAVKIQPLVKQLLVISPGVRDFTKKGHR